MVAKSNVLYMEKSLAWQRWQQVVGSGLVSAYRVQGAVATCQSMQSMMWIWRVSRSGRDKLHLGQECSGISTSPAKDKDRLCYTASQGLAVIGSSLQATYTASHWLAVIWSWPLSTYTASYWLAVMWSLPVSTDTASHWPAVFWSSLLST